MLGNGFRGFPRINIKPKFLFELKFYELGKVFLDEEKIIVICPILNT